MTTPAPRATSDLQWPLALKVAEAEVRIAFSLAAIIAMYAVAVGASIWLLRDLSGLQGIVPKAGTGMLGLLGTAVGWNLHVGFRTQAALRQGHLPPPILKWLAVTSECLLPTIGLQLSTSFIPAGEVMAAPFLPAYGIPIALSALRLHPLLSLYGGSLAAVSCIGVSIYATVGVDGIQGAFGTHLLRGVSIFAIGLATAVVASTLRTGFQSVLDAQDERNRVVGVFGRYLSDDVVDTLLHQPGGLALGGQKQPVTILMTDLRGFSTLASELPAEQVVQLLNHYLGRMTDIILDHGGTIDEFIGDAILVIFNAPLAQPDHPDRALRCAVAMQQAMAEVNAENVRAGLPTLEMGVGIHTGAAVVGNIGSEKRQKYGVVGTTVNLAARVESHTVGGQVLCTDACLSAASAEVHHSVFRAVHPKGASEPVVLHDVSGIGDLRLDRHDEPPEPVSPVAVEIYQIEGKERLATPVHGSVVALSDHRALLEGLSSPLSVGADIVVHTRPGSAFARIISVDGQKTELRFTAKDLDAQVRLTEWSG